MPAAARIPMLLLSLSAALLSGGRAEDLIPEWHNVETSHGTMRLREFGPHDGPLVICIHGMMDNDFIRDEWNPVAQKLAAADFHVLVPDFHSGPEALRPGAATGDDLRGLIAELTMHLDGFVPARYRAVVKPKVTVLGKSWGARMAAEAGQLPQTVAVGLVVPALSEETAARLLPSIHGDVALLMVRDDDIAPVSKAPYFKKLFQKEAKWVEAPRGGHRIVPDFEEPLVEFLEGVRERYTHDDEEVSPEL